MKKTEDQKTVDPGNGVSLSEVMKEAVDQGIDLNELKPGETVHFSMPAVMAAGATGSQSVSLLREFISYYADYGLGSYLTSPLLCVMG